MDAKIILKNHPQQKWVNIQSGYSVSTIWASDGTENEPDVYRCKNCMKRFVSP